MATPTQSFSIYKGDTFIADGVYREVNGSPVALEANGISIEAWLKTKNGDHLNIPVTYGNAVGSYHLQTDTANWPLGRNSLVVRYTQEGIKRTTQPVAVIVEPS